jgi:hypothetical protein
MSSCHGLLGFVVAAGVVISGLSWLYWLREIAMEVNKTLPEEERLQWSLLDKVPGRIHSFWAEHARLFPSSRTRTYAAISILLSVLIAVAGLTGCLLTSTSR